MCSVSTAAAAVVAAAAAVVHEARSHLQLLLEVRDAELVLLPITPL
jgi:hypothetical protein